MTPDLIWNEKFLSPENITLDVEQVGEAIALSQAATSEAQQWQTYLNGLAKFGLEEWLRKRAPELPVQRNPNLSGLRVNQFDLFLLARDNLYNEVNVPIAPQAPHFYVLIEVLEELEQVCIRGYIQHQQVIEMRDLLQRDEANYLLPLDRFELNPDKLLLSLRCLDPAAVEVRQSDRQPALQTAIRAGLWIQNQIDRLAEELSWNLLPPESFSFEFRPVQTALPTTPVEQFDQIIADLQRDRAITISPDSGAAYQDLRWEGLTLRLYVVVQALPIESTPEWSLLVILATPEDEQLSIGTSLKVQFESEVLEEAVLQNRNETFLYVQAIGALDEMFEVSVRLANGMEITLPLFQFE